MDTRVAPPADLGDSPSRPRRFADIRRTAAYFGVREQTARNWVRLRHFPTYRLGGRVVFDLDECDAIIAETMRPAISQRSALLEAAAG